MHHDKATRHKQRITILLEQSRISSRPHTELDCTKKMASPPLPRLLYVLLAGEKMHA
jgi:hypothetical protein